MAELTLLSNFLKTGFSNVRSNKKRSTELNRVMIDLVKSYRPDLRDLVFDQEKSIPDTYNYYPDGQLRSKIKTGKNKGKFKRTIKADCVGFNPDPHTIVLGKSINSSAGKNLFNYHNTTLGEMHRVLDGPQENTIENLIFLTIYPRRAPLISKNIICRLDNIAERMRDTNPYYSVRKYDTKNKISFMVFEYDIGGVDTFIGKSRDVLYEIVPENIKLVDTSEFTAPSSLTDH